MEKINAVITGIGGYVPEYVLNNDELSRMVDTNDEWIMTRIGVKERRILNEEGLLMNESRIIVRNNSVKNKILGKKVTTGTINTIEDLHILFISEI